MGNKGLGTSDCFEERYVYSPLQFVGVSPYTGNKAANVPKATLSIESLNLTGANLCLGFALNQRIVPGSGVRCRELAESSSRNEFGERRETATFARQTKKQRDLLFSFTTQKPLSRFKY